MAEKSSDMIKLYITDIPIYTHPLLDEAMILGTSRFFVDLEVTYRQIENGFRGASADIKRCVGIHWHMKTPMQDKSLRLFAVNGYLAIDWESIKSGLVETIIRMMPGEVQDISAEGFNLPTMDKLDDTEIEALQMRIRMAMIANLFGDILDDSDE